MNLAHVNDHSSLTLIEKIIHFATGWHGFLLLSIVILALLLIKLIVSEREES